MTREELSDLIGRIYDCALDPALWSDTIGRVAAVAEAQAGLVMVHDLLDQASVRTFQSGVPALAMRLYERRYAAANPIARFAATRSEGDVDTLRSMFPDGAWERSATYREWAWPLGIGDVLGMAVLRSERRGVWLGAARRGKGRPDFGPEQVRLFRLLAPHVVRSMRVSDILDLRKVEAGRLAEALDGLSAAVWLLDGEARVSHRNAAAERHAAQPGGGALRVVRGRLVASRPASSAALEAAVRAALAGAHGPPLAPHSIPLGGEAEEQRVIATVLPLAGGKAAGLVRGGAAGAAVFLQDPSAAAPGPSDAFAALHGLTRAEARFLAALAAGRTVPEASDHLGISQATGRTHLTRIFGKTGTSRQPELVRLMLASAPPLRHG
jgi:DNA-binding CsgD family transcriptional regulator/PAS domain-containing protein